MKKPLLLLLTVLASVSLTSCATVDVRTDISTDGSAKRQVEAYVDATTYRFNKDTVDAYTKNLTATGGDTVIVSEDNGWLKITATISANSIPALEARTIKIFTQSGVDCGFTVDGSFDSFGFFQKTITVKEAITTKCLEYITGVSTYRYNGTEIGQMQYPNDKSAEFKYETPVAPLVMILMYLLSAIVVSLLLVVGYIMELPIIKDVADFFIPSFRKLYYKLILLIFSPKTHGKQR